MKQTIVRAGAYGLLAWLVYGVIELALTVGFGLFFKTGTQILAWQWWLVGLLWVAYALFGVILGCAGGWFLVAIGRNGLRDGPQIVAALTLELAFLVNLAPAWPLARSEYSSVAVAVLLAAGLAAALASDAWHGRGVVLTDPWAVSLLLIGGPWISREVLAGRSTGLKTGIALLFFLAIIAYTTLGRRLRPNRVIALRRQAATAVTVMGMLVAVLLSGTNTSTASANPPSVSGGKTSPDILLITMDTVRADHLSVYGYERDTTPNLRRLAQEATVYTRAIATSDFTLPTHASIFTGLYPSTHGAILSPPEYTLGRPLASNQVTLAEMLRSHGYRTSAVVANYSYLDPSLGLNQGFSEYDSHRLALLAQANLARPFYLREGALSVLSLAMDVRPFYSSYLRAEDVNRRAMALIEKGRPNVPMFLFLNYMDAHGPYEPPAPFDVRYPGKDPGFGLSEHDRARDAVNSGKRILTVAETNHLISQYDGGIAYMDDEIGNLLARLRQLGLYENTLIIITSDHGEAFGEHHLMAHGVSSVYQDQVHVPLLIKFPGQHEGRRVEDLTSHVDLMPTALDVVGIKPPFGLQGQSLRTTRTRSNGAVYSEARTGETPYAANPWFRGNRQAIFSGSWKLIAWTLGPPELYDLATDPSEEHNVYRADDPVARALAARLAAWRSTSPRPIVKTRELDSGSVERLKSLGYVQ